MFSRAALTVFVLSVAELMLLGAAVKAWGAAIVVAATLVSAVIGAALLRRQLLGFFSNGLAGSGIPGRSDRDRAGWVRPDRDGAVPAGGRGAAGGTQWMTDTGLRLLAGVLLVIPGFLTSAVGALLTVPPVRAVGAGWVRRRLPSLTVLFDVPVPANGRSPHRRDVVDVDVVAEDMPKSARSELN